MSQANTGRLSESEQQSCAALYRQYNSAIVRKVRRLLQGDAATAEDLAQEVFVAVSEAQAKGNLPKDPQHLQGWLFITARNIVCNYFREHGKMGVVRVSDKTPDPAKCLEDLADKRSESNESNIIDLATVRACLETLPKKHQEVILACAEGLTPAEVAAWTGLTLKTVPVYASTGRKQLKQAAGWF